MLRKSSAIALLWMISGSTAIASPSELQIVSLDWMAPCSLPSVTADSSLTRDAQIVFISDPEPAQAATVSDSCADCDSGLLWVAPSCEPTYCVSVGAVFLHRSRPDKAVIVSPPTGTLGSIINGSDYGFGWEAGPDLTISRRMDENWIWEGRYFNNRDSSATADISSITTFRIAGIGVTILGSGPINTLYTTDLDSSEINLHRQITEGCTIFGGFRWIELHDRLNVDIASPAAYVRWDDNNHLYGGQMGTDLALTNPGNPLRMIVALKAGAFANVADNRMTSTIVARDSSDDTALAFVGEIDFSAAYPITKHIALRGGYQVMWLDNVQLASDAAPTTTQVVGGTSSPANVDGRLWYNGAAAAVDFVW